MYTDYELKCLERLSRACVIVSADGMKERVIADADDIEMALAITKLCLLREKKHVTINQYHAYDEDVYIGWRYTVEFEQDSGMNWVNRGN